MRGAFRTTLPLARRLQAEGPSAEGAELRTVSHHTGAESRLSSYVVDGQRHFAYVARPEALNSQAQLERVETSYKSNATLV